jgi:hypothetical protein
MIDYVKDIWQLFPDFRKARRKRNEIRAQCRTLLHGIDSGGDYKLINNPDRELSYLSNQAEIHCIKADEILKENSAELRDNAVRFSNMEANAKEDLIDQLNQAILEINKQQRWSKMGEFILILLVIFVLGLSVVIGLIGVDSIRGMV